MPNQPKGSLNKSRELINEYIEWKEFFMETIKNKLKKYDNGSLEGSLDEYITFNDFIIFLEKGDRPDEESILKKIMKDIFAI